MLGVSALKADGMAQFVAGSRERMTRHVATSNQWRTARRSTRASHATPVMPIVKQPQAEECLGGATMATAA